MLFNKAEKWRKENGEYYEGGVVVFYQDEIMGWVNELRDPQTWRPGCVAVDQQGNEYIATGGNEYDGAHSWQKLLKAA